MVQTTNQVIMVENAPESQDKINTVKFNLKDEDEIKSIFVEKPNGFYAQVKLTMPKEYEGPLMERNK